MPYCSSHPLTPGLLGNNRNENKNRLQASTVNTNPQILRKAQETASSATRTYYDSSFQRPCNVVCLWTLLEAPYVLITCLINSLLLNNSSWCPFWHSPKFFPLFIFYPNKRSNPNPNHNPFKDLVPVVPVLLNHFIVSTKKKYTVSLTFSPPSSLS